MEKLNRVFGAAAFVMAMGGSTLGFVLVSSWVNVFPYTVMVQQDIKTPQDLKGKVGHVGAPSGAIPDVALRFALTKLGLDPEKDVRLVQIARPDPANIIAQRKEATCSLARLRLRLTELRRNAAFVH